MIYEYFDPLYIIGLPIIILNFCGTCLLLLLFSYCYHLLRIGVITKPFIDNNSTLTLNQRWSSPPYLTSSIYDPSILPKIHSLCSQSSNPIDDSTILQQIRLLFNDTSQSTTDINSISNLEKLRSLSTIDSDDISNLEELHSLCLLEKLRSQSTIDNNNMSNLEELHPLSLLEKTHSQSSQIPEQPPIDDIDDIIAQVRSLSSKNDLPNNQSSLEDMADTLISVTKNIAGALDNADHIPKHKKNELATLLKGIPEFLNKVVDLNDKKSPPSQNSNIINHSLEQRDFLMKTLDSLRQ